MNVREYLKRYPRLMDFAAMVYNLFHRSNAWRVVGCKNVVEYKGAFLDNVKFAINGIGNTIVIGRMARLRNCTIGIDGNNCKIILGGVAQLSLIQAFTSKMTNAVSK